MRGARPLGSLLLATAGLMGAAGVALAAAAAHGPSGTGLQSAASMLLIHAGAIAALAAVLDSGLAWRPLCAVAAASIAAGALLFAGDVALRALAQTRLFPLAAPTGGVLMILGWSAAALAAIIRLVRGESAHHSPKR